MRFSNNFFFAPTNHSLLARMSFFVCGRLSFVVEARRCVLFDAYATQFLLEGLGCQGVHHARWSIAACPQCWKIVALFVLVQCARE